MNLVKFLKVLIVLTTDASGLGGTVYTTLQSVINKLNNDPKLSKFNMKENDVKSFLYEAYQKEFVQFEKELKCSDDITYSDYFTPTNRAVDEIKSKKKSDLLEIIGLVK